MKSINFNKIEKRYLTVTLNDEERTTLLIMSPTKKVLESLMEIESISKYNEANDDQIDLLYDVCATVMSRNKGGIKISKEKLEGIFDTEDIIIFFDGYMQFMNEQMASKN
ncbi:hypothetical protein [Clostridium sp. CCUG 7971]|uniref:hypothetical protein n=1 Tax=Clostridium sp. CCUG 7971 TaxID=2811414 RepID=UPI001ABA7943|nr:hypothetical protein [Clostridium sp. CCUG 7971]MBO3443414.1 hypothetical protein [Clostridium sp. CCUG 7971]